MCNYIVNVESAKGAEVRLHKSATKLPLKNCMKAIDAMIATDGRGAKARKGAERLAEAMSLVGYNKFSTSLLTFMDAERTKLIALYAAPNSKEESKLCMLVDAANELADDSTLGEAVRAAHSHLEEERAKLAERAEKAAKAREEQIKELTAYFVGQGMSEAEAALTAAQCRIIKSAKGDRPLWGINDLIASFAYTKAEELAEWHEGIIAAEEAQKAERAAKKAKREAEKAETKETAIKGLESSFGRALTMEEMLIVETALNAKRNKKQA